MPCHDGGWNEQLKIDDAIRPWKERNDQLARMLCGLCKFLVRRGQKADLYEVPDLAEWWEEHERQDRKREEAKQKEKERKRQIEILELQRLQKKYPNIG